MSVDTGLDEAVEELELNAPGGRDGGRIVANPELADSGIDISYIPPSPPDLELHLRFFLFVLFLLLPAFVIGTVFGATIALGVWASCWTQTLSFSVTSALAVLLLIVYYWRSARSLFIRLRAEGEPRRSRRRRGRRLGGRNVKRPFFPGLYIVGFFVYLIVLNAVYPLTSNHVSVICGQPNGSYTHLLSSSKYSYESTSLRSSSSPLFESSASRNLYDNKQSSTVASSKPFVDGPNVTNHFPLDFELASTTTAMNRNRRIKKPGGNMFLDSNVTSKSLSHEYSKFSSPTYQNQTLSPAMRSRMCVAMHILRVLAVLLSASAALCLIHFSYDTWTSRKAHLPTAPRISTFLQAAAAPANRAAQFQNQRRRCCCNVCTLNCVQCTTCLMCRRMYFLLCWVFAIVGWALYPRRYSPPQRPSHRARLRAGGGAAAVAGAVARNNQNDDAVSDQVDVV